MQASATTRLDVRDGGRTLRKSFELVAPHGPAQHHLDPEFARLDADPPGALDAAHDLPNMPLEEEPQRVRQGPGGRESAVLKDPTRPASKRGTAMQNVVAALDTEMQLDRLSEPLLFGGSACDLRRDP